MSEKTIDDIIKEMREALIMALPIAVGYESSHPHRSIIVYDNGNFNPRTVTVLEVIGFIKAALAESEARK